MKKFTTICLLVVLCISLTACSKYGKKDVSVYDTQTGKYLYLETSKEDVRKVLGEPAKSTETADNYSDMGLDVIYKDNKAILFRLWRKAENTNDRILIANKLNAKASNDDFKALYIEAHDSNDIGPYINFKKDGSSLEVLPNGEKAEETVSVHAYEVAFTIGINKE